MVEPLSTLTVLVCSAICMRLITYRRAGAFPPRRFPVRLPAGVVHRLPGAGNSGGLYRAEHLSPWMLGVLLVLLVLLLQAQRQPGAGPAPALNERTSLRPGRRLYPPRRCLSVIHPS